jgi:hypothetical protein
LIEFVETFIRDHYEAHSTPLMLAQLGAEIRSNGYEIPGKIPLKEYLETQFGPAMPVVQNPDVRASVAVALPDNRAAIEQQILSPGRKVLQAQEALAKFPRSMLIAFCRSLPDNQRIFLRITPPVRYMISATPLSAPYVEIQDNYRMPGEQIYSIQELDDSKKVDLADRIARWLRDNEITPEKLFMRTSVRPVTLRRGGSNSLERLLEAQSDDVKRKLLLPADIVALLLSHE